MLSRQKYLLSCAVMALLIGGVTNAEAKISPKAFKDITEYFKQGKEYYSPVLGEAALESGLIHDLRFYGNIERAYKDDQRPDYINDKALDPVAQLVKQFFPSPAGHLSVETTAQINFAKYVQNSETVALLFNFAKDTRAYLERQHTLLQEKKAENKRKEGISQQLKAVQSTITNIKQDIQANNQVKEAVKKNSSLNKEEREAQLNNLQSQNEVLANIFKENEIQKTLLAKEMKGDKARLLNTAEQENQEAFKKKRDDILKRILGSLDLKPGDSGVEDTLQGILHSIELSLEHEKDSPYPLHTTEQIISAFFCEKFDTQNDIWQLLKHLDADIVDKSKALPDKEDYLDEEDLSKIAQKATPYNLDDVFDLVNADLFSLIVPYKPGTHLLSNGNTYPYDRKTDTIIKIKGTFADCAEMVGRHVMNLLLFNENTKTFDLNSLEEYVKTNSPDNPYFKAFKTFYQVQTPNLANAGDIEMRSRWNKVVGDLNAPDDTLQVNYKKGILEMLTTYEVRSGFINFIHTFQKVFGLKIDDLPQEGFAVKKVWLEKSLNTLFTTLNPLKAYEINLSNLWETHGELSGTIPIKVIDPTTKEDLFSFNFYMEYGIHSEVRDLKILKKVETIDYSDALDSHANKLQDKSTDESLWLLKEGLKIKAYHPLYSLFQTALADNDSRIRALDKVSTRYSEMAKNPALGPILPRILKNILADMSWEDKAVLIKVSPVISNLMKVKELGADIISMVKGFYLSQESDLKEPHLQPLWSHLTHLAIHSKISNVEGIEICKVLKHLDLENSAVKTVRLDSFSNLEVLNLRNTKSLKELSIKNLSNLTALNLSSSVVEKLDGLDTLAHLQNLNLSFNKGIKELSVKNLSNLTAFALNQSVVETLSLHTLTNLKMLNLNSNKGLKELSIKNLSNLTALNLRNSVVEKLDGLDTLTNLQNLNLCLNKELKELSVNNLSNLTELDLSYSVVEKLDGLDTLTNLQNLNLCFNQGLKELSIKNLSNLTALNLSDSEVETLRFHTLTNLKKLDLKNTRSLKSLEFTTDMKELNLDLRGSGVKKSQIKGLGHLDPNKIIE